MTASDLINAVRSQCSKHPTRAAIALWADPEGQGVVALDLSEDSESDDEVAVIGVFIARPERRQIGSRAMNWLCKLADEAKVVLILDPKPLTDTVFEDDPPRTTPLIDRAKLIEFYSNFGFVVDQDDESQMRRPVNLRKA